MELNDFLRVLAARDGSDLYLTAGAPPAAKFQGSLKALSKDRMTPEQLEAIANQLMDDEQRQQFAQKPEMNLAMDEEGIGRFRVNIFKQRHHIALVIRNIKTEIPDADALGLPPILKETIMQKRGLILFVGGTGSGKSTSLAALIDYRNRNSDGHIITIEDPIEYVHPHRRSIVNQREVGVDTDSYEDALKNTLRQAPDVILIGEIRSRETMEHALAFAETGHLCLSTLHANNSNQALDRIINFFPEERRNQLLMDLSMNLRGFISQRLIPTVDGKRTAAIEILLGTSTITDLIHKGDFGSIKEIMEKSEELGMQTFDSHLYRMYMEQTISLAEALRNSDSPNNLKLRINLSAKKPVEPAADGDPEQPQPEGTSSTDLSTLSLEPKAEEEADEDEQALF